MSVRVKDRTPSKFELLDKALDLAVYTTDILANEKTFDPKYKTTIDRIQAEATMIYHLCRSANCINVKTREQAETRLKLQKEALSYCEPLVSDIMIAHKLFHLSLKRVKYWSAQVETIKVMIPAWMASDRKKYKNYGL